MSDFGWPQISYSDPSSLKLSQKLGNQFLSRLILMHSMIIEVPYANEYLPYDRLLEPIEGKCKICKFSGCLRNNHSQRNT